jgi:cyclophilin family peptidyl-prolyl cis-trans isomerase
MKLGALNSPARLLLFGLLLLAAPGAQANTLVDIQFNLGLPRPAGSFDTVRLELFDSAPVTVANFLRYADNPGYQNSILHRLVPGFVLQGGGFSIQTDDTGQVVALPPIPTYPPIVNEFSPQRSNLRGTVAMAKLGGDPNSATSQWFFNLNNNSSNLDNQNGGFTVFARVVGEGMTLIDAFAGVERRNLNAFYDPSYNPAFPNNGPFTDVPLANGNTFIVIEQVTAVGKSGDADGNGIVNSLTGFANGDFDGDGAVDGDDYAMIDRAFFAGMPLGASGPAPMSVTATVPEPAALTLVASVSLLMCRRSRRAGRACRR